MRRQLLDGTRAAITYAALGALCAVTSLGGASAASWGGPPTRLDVDTASVLRADYTAGPALLLPGLSREVIDSARQDAGTQRADHESPAPGGDSDALAAVALLPGPSEGDRPSLAIAPPAASESMPESVLGLAIPEDGAVDAAALSPAPSRGTAAVTEVAVPAIDPSAAGPALEPAVADSGPTPVTGVSAANPLSLTETLLAAPPEPLEPLVNDPLVPLLEPDSLVEVPVLAEIELPLDPPSLELATLPILPDLPLIGGLFHVRPVRSA